jgi:hypothetical protein
MSGCHAADQKLCLRASVTGRIGNGVGMTYPRSLFRVAPVIVLLASTSILANNFNPHPDVAETSGGTIIVFNGYPILSRGNELWSFEYKQPKESERCWQKIADLYRLDAEIHTLLPIGDVLEIGTLNDGLWYFDGKQIGKETGSLSVQVINALAQTEQEKILIGTLGGTRIDKKESGLWTWTRSTNTWDDDPNNDLPAYADVTAIMVDPYSSPKTVYVGTMFFGIYKQEPGWWKKMDGAALKNGGYATFYSEIQQIAVSLSGNDHIVYAAAATTQATHATNQGFFRMEPDAEDAVWQRPQSDGNPYGYNVWSVAPDPDIGRGVWIGTEKGLFYSSNAGDEWKQIEIHPEPAKIQAILPFNDYWLIILTSDGVMKASLSESRGSGKSSPRWIKYDDASEERRCPIPGSLATKSNSSAVSPVPSVTGTPMAAVSPSTVESRTPSITTTPAVPPTPLTINIGDYVLGIISVLLVLAAIIGMWMYIQRSRRKTTLFLSAEPADAAQLQKKYILFLSAEPTNADHLRVEDEKEKIIEVLQKSTLRDRYELKDRQAVRPEKLTEALLQIKPKIVHFAGHGTESGEICLEKKSGKALPVSPEDLANLFKQFTGQVECVILNTCYASKQAAAIAKHIDFVIGVKKEIDNEAAIAFSTGFYQKLGEEYDIEKAYDFGCVQMGLEKIEKDLKPILKKKKI